MRLVWKFKGLNVFAHVSGWLQRRFKTLHDHHNSHENVPFDGSMAETTGI